MNKLIVLSVAGLALLSGCSEQLGDRGGKEGAPADLVSDVDYIDVFRNADHFPNIGRTCVLGLGFAVPSTGEGESGGATPVIRVPEWDAFCATKMKR